MVPEQVKNLKRGASILGTTSLIEQAHTLRSTQAFRLASQFAARSAITR
jgi:hypothetical protein